MNCRKAKKCLPLASGNDLPVLKAQKLQSHLGKCASCRVELEHYRFVLARTKNLAQEEVRAWQENDWKEAVRKATARQKERKPSLFRLLLRPSFLAAAGILLIAVLGIFVLWIDRSRLHDVVKAQTNQRQGGAVADVLKGPAPSMPKAEPPPRKQEPGAPADQKKKLNHAQVRSASSAVAPAEARQDVLSATFISRDTGLKIVWFFNKNFEWKGEGI